MKIYRVVFESRIRYAFLDGEGLVFMKNDLSEGSVPTETIIPMKEAVILSPCTPSKIVAAGLNYRDHAQELSMPVPEEPVLFLKPGTSVVGPGDVIYYPEMSGQVDYEAELAVVIGRQARNVEPRDAEAYILGYTCFNDVTARDLQRRDGQWTRAKSFDTFAPLGPCIETELNPDNLLVEAFLNGEMKQSSSTANLIFSVRKLVGFVSRVMTLFPGDVIATGTPPGVGAMQPGDTVEVRIQGIGSLVNTVKRASVNM
ncbi:MAG: fumarylacetoacetate hydrolase family protein [bacterium]